MREELADMHAEREKTNANLAERPEGIATGQTKKE
jgi:hypothetical protein